MGSIYWFGHIAKRIAPADCSAVHFGKIKWSGGDGGGGAKLRFFSFSLSCSPPTSQIEYFPFWNGAGFNSFLEGGTLDQCVGIHVNEQTIFYVISFGLFVSALSLSDQLVRLN